MELFGKIEKFTYRSLRVRSSILAFAIFLVGVNLVLKQQIAALAPLIDVSYCKMRTFEVIDMFEIFHYQMVRYELNLVKMVVPFIEQACLRPRSAEEQDVTVVVLYFTSTQAVVGVRKRLGKLDAA